MQVMKPTSSSRCLSFGSKEVVGAACAWALMGTLLLLVQPKPISYFTKLETGRDLLDELTLEALHGECERGAAGQKQIHDVYQDDRPYRSGGQRPQHGDGVIQRRRLRQPL